MYPTMLSTYSARELNAPRWWLDDIDGEVGGAVAAGVGASSSSRSSGAEEAAAFIDIS